MDETRYLGFFAGERRAFFLPMARIIVIQRETGASVFELFYWMGEHLRQAGDELVIGGPSPVNPDQLQSVIRNGLIGAGMAEEQAYDLIETYTAPARPAARDMELAYRILEALIYGVQVKKNNNPADDSQETSTKDKSSPTAPPSE